MSRKKAASIPTFAASRCTSARTIRKARFPAILYAANSCVFVGNGPGFHTGKTLAAFEDTASWMLLAEEASFDPLRSSTDDGYFYIISDTRHNVFSKRHLGGSNLSFLDGHCKALRDSSVIAGKYHTGGEDIAMRLIPRCAHSCSVS